MKLTTILTSRQNEIFMLAVKGYSQKKIAEKLRVTTALVSWMLRKVYEKLDVRNLVEAISECLSHGLLTMDDLKKKGGEV